ncbi:hypothetical protein MRS76_22890 [Rhizobiaceae bacterium n13]|uniref:Lipoprotein n=1 Tax=Ferirhizobium litorale TaxID=2927786 RepID=A0AAE3QB92_9HYPH|nr:hypothetical protein [Fererhizobium litorale]MDI7864779.1 hypothetical protein [Fererhizobium litorale]MDI7921691.1 hypothetical protein [Fererhizobium litorale]
MKKTHGLRVTASIAGLLGACLTLTGCLGPTYGTDKSSSVQLIEDLADATSLKSITKREENLAYQPRPGLVVPGKTAEKQLVQPQQSLAGKSNPQWLESPEDTRDRLKEEAEANKGSSSYRSPLAQADANGRKLSTEQQFEQYRAARREQQGAYDGRRFLSDPPTTYREVGDDAQLADLGEPESKKEKRRKKEAVAAKQDSKWWMPFQ